MTRKAPSRRILLGRLDKAFSRFIRQSAADHQGYVQCVTCRKRLPWQESQAGHWIKRGHHAVRWDERNVYPQCAGCNLHKNGAQDEMGCHILETHGEAVFRELIALKHTAKRWTMGELRELIAKYGSS